MKIGLYTIFSLILIVIIGVFVHFVDPSRSVQKILGIEFNLPISIWYILPMLTLLFFTLLHMIFYKVGNYFSHKKFTRDVEALNDGLYWSLLQEPKEQKFMTREIGDGAKILGKSTINVTAPIDGLSPKFNEILNLINTIKDGMYVDPKANPILKKLSRENPLNVRNTLNRLDADQKFAEEVLLGKEGYSAEILQKALGLFASRETLFKAKKYAKLFNIENFFVILKRGFAGEDVGMSEEMIKSFMAELPSFGCNEYMNLAQICIKKFSPDSNLAMFKEFQKKDEDASSSYLYLLFEYEMMEAIEEYLEDHDEGELIRFRALYTLKKMNNKYNANELIGVNTACNAN